MTKHLVFIGYRGVGKSRIARYLKKQLDCPLYAIDELIEGSIGMTILDFIKENSWDAFRDLETKMVEKCLDHHPGIVDCGGGIIERAENIPLLKKMGPVFWLQAPNSVILHRLALSGHRPSLCSDKSVEDEVAEVLVRRTPLYQKACDYVIDVSDDDIPVIADTIIKEYHNHYQPSS